MNCGGRSCNSSNSSTSGCGGGSSSSSNSSSSSGGSSAEAAATAVAAEAKRKGAHGVQEKYPRRDGPRRLRRATRWAEQYCREEYCREAAPTADRRRKEYRPPGTRRGLYAPSSMRSPLRGRYAVRGERTSPRHRRWGKRMRRGCSDQTHRSTQGITEDREAQDGVARVARHCPQSNSSSSSTSGCGSSTSSSSNRSSSSSNSGCGSSSSSSGGEQQQQLQQHESDGGSHRSP